MPLRLFFLVAAVVSFVVALYAILAVPDGGDVLAWTIGGLLALTLAEIAGGRRG